MNPFQVVQIITDILFILFLPGLTLSFILFSQGKIDFLERLAPSFAFLISIVPLLAFYANLVGIPIKIETVFIEVVLIVMSALLGNVVKRKFNSFIKP